MTPTEFAEFMTRTMRADKRLHSALVDLIQDVVRDAYAEGIKASAPKLIPVGERLPDAKIYVLVANHGGKITLARRFIYLEETEKSVWIDADGFTHEVTHWMPLPELPK
jgi:hypothetical protein